MNERFSDTSMLSDEELEMVRRARALHQQLHATRNQPLDGGLPPYKESFSVGIRPDGTVDLVPDDADAAGHDDAGDHDGYRLVLASDVLGRDGVGLELHAPDGRVVAEIFRDDRTGILQPHSAPSLPTSPEILRWFVARAQQLLCPTSDGRKR